MFEQEAQAPISRVRSIGRCSDLPGLADGKPRDLLQIRPRDGTDPRVSRCKRLCALGTCATEIRTCNKSQACCRSKENGANQRAEGVCINIQRQSSFWFPFKPTRKWCRASNKHMPKKGRNNVSYTRVNLDGTILLCPLYPKDHGRKRTNFHPTHRSGRVASRPSWPPPQ